MTVSLVTGAGGFVGGHLCDTLQRCGGVVRRVSSRPDIASVAGVALATTDEAALEEVLAGAQTVYFTAGIAHRGGVRDAEFEAVNVRAPERWLRAADRAGVQRFVWLSSIKVLGDVSDRPLTVEDPYRPGDGYARSKVDAERALLATPCSHTRLIIVRPPLVYGPGVAGNFRQLLRLAASGWPLPLAGATAPRSLVAVGNLCDLLRRLATDENVAAGTYHLADAADVTVSALLAEVRRMLGRPRRLFALPRPALAAAARSAGQGAAFQRLFEPLQVDASATCAALGWTPPRLARDALEETVQWYLTSR